MINKLLPVIGIVAMSLLGCQQQMVIVTVVCGNEEKASDANDDKKMYKTVSLPLSNENPDILTDISVDCEVHK